MQIWALILKIALRALFSAKKNAKKRTRATKNSTHFSERKAEMSAKNERERAQKKERTAGLHVMCRRLLSTSISLFTTLRTLNLDYNDDARDEFSYLDALTAEHVPHPEYAGPGECAGEGAEKPLCHVQDRLNLLQGKRC